MVAIPFKYDGVAIQKCREQNLVMTQIRENRPLSFTINSTKNAANISHFYAN